MEMFGIKFYSPEGNYVLVLMNSDFPFFPVLPAEYMQNQELDLIE